MKYAGSSKRERGFERVFPRERSWTDERFRDAAAEAAPIADEHPVVDEQRAAEHREKLSSTSGSSHYT